jgi:hypothetical protein
MSITFVLTPATTGDGIGSAYYTFGSAYYTFVVAFRKSAPA